MQLTQTNMATGDASSGKADSFSMKLQELVAALGGNENIANITHCMTRLRFKLVDESKADKAKLEAIQGVKGVVLGQGQTQVIIGVDVEKWYLALSGASAAPEDAEIEQEKGKLFQNAMRVVAGIFGPVVPAIAGSGMLMGPNSSPKCDTSSFKQPCTFLGI